MEGSVFIYFWLDVCVAVKEMEMQRGLKINVGVFTFHEKCYKDMLGLFLATIL